MSNTKKEYAIGQLIETATKIQEGLVNVRPHSKDDDLDAEYKTGAREAFLLAIKIIHKQVWEIESEIEQK